MILSTYTIVSIIMRGMWYILFYISSHLRPCVLALFPFTLALPLFIIHAIYTPCHATPRTRTRTRTQYTEYTQIYTLRIFNRLLLSFYFSSLQNAGCVSRLQKGAGWRKDSSCEKRRGLADRRNAIHVTTTIRKFLSRPLTIRNCHRKCAFERCAAWKLSRLLKTLRFRFFLEINRVKDKKTIWAKSKGSIGWIRQIGERSPSICLYAAVTTRESLLGAW